MDQIDGLMGMGQMGQMGPMRVTSVQMKQKGQIGQNGSDRLYERHAGEACLLKNMSPRQVFSAKTRTLDPK